MGRRANWLDIVNDLDESFGWSNIDDDRTLVNVYNDPPRRDDETACDRRQELLLFGVLHAIKQISRELAATRSAIERLPEKMEKQKVAERLKLAKEERKAAEARERAASRELEAKFAEPPVQYQCDRDTLDELSGNIRRRF